VSIYRNRVLPTFGKRKVTEVTRADVQAWVTALHGEGLAPQTVHHCYVSLEKAFRYAQDDRLISYNPCDSIRLPKNADAHDFAPVFLTPSEVETLAQHLDTLAPYALLLRFAAYTGLRAAEITGLRIRDLNLKAGHVEVRQTLQRIDGEWQVGTPKSKRSTREVPLLTRALKADMREYLFAHPNRTNPDALLWPGRMPGTHVVDFSRVFDVASFRRNYLRPALCPGHARDAVPRPAPHLRVADAQRRSPAPPREPLDGPREPRHHRHDLLPPVPRRLCRGARRGLAAFGGATLGSRVRPTEHTGRMDHHEMMETAVTHDRYGRYVFVWRCTCGRKGSGSPTERAAFAAYKRHLQSRARREHY